MSKHQSTSISRQFRGVAGLPERTADKPSDATDDAPELETFDGPEGGYGGVSEEEYRPQPEPVDEDGKTASEVEQAEAEGDKPPAKKTAAKKTAAKKSTAKKAPAKKTAAKKTAAKKGGK